MAKKPEGKAVALRQRMIDDMVLAGLSQGTQRAHIQGVRSLAARYRRSPHRIIEEEVRGFCSKSVMTARPPAPSRSSTTRSSSSIARHSTAIGTCFIKRDSASEAETAAGCPFQPTGPSILG